MRRLPPLPVLLAFEATARLGSMTAAAKELGRTHSSISKQIRQLNDDLGGGLFEKSGNGLRLTTRGEKLSRLLTPLLNDLSAASHALRAETQDRAILIGLSTTLAVRWLSQRLPRFYAQHPGVEVRLLTNRLMEIPDSEIDILLSYDRLRDSFRHDDYLSLGDTKYGPVCVPGYLLRHDDNNWSAPVRLVQKSAAHTWDAWQLLSGKRLVSERLVEHVHHFLALDAAATGKGVALAEERLVRADIAAGRLVAPLGFTGIKDGFRATVMPRAYGRPSVTPLLNWLAAEADRNDIDDS
jgi:DNA-binding transcriptional LysR family regulator